MTSCQEHKHNVPCEKIIMTHFFPITNQLVLYYYVGYQNIRLCKHVIVEIADEVMVRPTTHQCDSYHWHKSCNLLQIMSLCGGACDHVARLCDSHTPYSGCRWWLISSSCLNAGKRSVFISEPLSLFSLLHPCLDASSLLAQAAVLFLVGWLVVSGWSWITACSPATHRLPAFLCLWASQANLMLSNELSKETMCLCGFFSPSCVRIDWLLL